MGLRVHILVVLHTVNIQSQINGLVQQNGGRQIQGFDGYMVADQVLEIHSHQGKDGILLLGVHELKMKTCRNYAKDQRIFSKTILETLFLSTEKVRFCE